MKLLTLCLNALLSLNLLAGSLFPAANTASLNALPAAPAARIDGFGVEMSALPALNAENVASVVEQIASTGAGYMRQVVDWSAIENAPGEYDWNAAAPLDLLFAAASAQGIKIVAVLTGGPVYLAAEGQPVSRSVVRERWALFVQAAVAHFGELVDIWEIGSAENSAYALTPFLTPLSPDQPLGPNVNLYSKLLSSASDIIKTADPNDQVWLGSLTGLFNPACEMNPLTMLLELNAVKSWRDFDAILYTPTQGSAAPEFQAAGTINSACASNLMITPASLSEELLAVQELARQLGGKPVYVNGLGWDSAALSALGANREISADQLQADLLVRASAALMSQNSIPLIFWQADITANKSAKRALTNLQDALHNTKALGRAMREDGAVNEYYFRKNGKQTIVAWYAQNGDAGFANTLQLGDIPSVTAWSADARSLTSDSGQVLTAGVDGNAALQLSERPLILIGRSGDLAQNVKFFFVDQAELIQIELGRLLKRWLNDAKSEVVALLDRQLDKAKDSALQWGEDKLDELLP